jgi:hypothetical protein
MKCPFCKTEHWVASPCGIKGSPSDVCNANGCTESASTGGPKLGYYCRECHKEILRLGVEALQNLGTPTQPAG